MVPERSSKRISPPRIPWVISPLRPEDEADLVNQEEEPIQFRIIPGYKAKEKLAYLDEISKRMTIASK